VPENLEQLVSAAARAHSAGRLEEAERLALRGLDLVADDVQALLLLGVIAAKRGHFEKSQGYLERVVSGDPSSVQAPLWLSIGLLARNRAAEALSAAERAARLDPNNPIVANQVGLCLLHLGRFVDAESWFRRALAISPKLAPAAFGLGQTLLFQKRNREAIVAFRQATELNPSDFAAVHRLAETAMTESDAETAAGAAERMLELNPRSAAAHLILARARIETGEPEKALSHVEEAARLGADEILCELTKGHVLRGMGDLPGALNAFEHAIALGGDRPEAYLAIVQTKRITDTDRPLVSRLNQIVAPDSSERHYALGKAHEDLGDYMTAMENFDAANRIEYERKFGRNIYRTEDHRAGFDRLAEIFTSKFLDHEKSLGRKSEVPVFVIGMMRSGTTLVERILSSHPEIGAAGEQRFWTERRAGILDLRTGSLDREKLQRSVDEYVQRLLAIAPGSARVVDKMPINYTNVGLLHVAFPNARFVSTVRTPADVAISIWTTPNRSRVEWSHNKSNIVFAYRQYERLMKHWREILPPNRLLDVSYESLVQDQEAVSRQLIEFCGLDWDETCLNPEKNPSAVSTPSVWQVRQPVYQTSIGRWRHYEPYLGAFRDFL